MQERKRGIVNRVSTFVLRTSKDLPHGGASVAIDKESCKAAGTHLSTANQTFLRYLGCWRRPHQCDAPAPASLIPSSIDTAISDNEVMDTNGISGSATVERLSTIPWCRALLESPDWTQTRIASRVPKASTEDSYYAETLGTQRTMRSCTALRPTEECKAASEDVYYDELRVIYELGDGVNGWPSKCVSGRLLKSVSRIHVSPRSLSGGGFSWQKHDDMSPSRPRPRPLD